MKKYEYRHLVFDDLHLNEALDACNKMGRAGWELVSHSVYCDSSITEGCNICHYYYFKQEILCQNTQS